MKFVIALVSYLESLGYDTSSLRKSADGSKAIVHMQYAEILSKNLDTNANVTIYDRVNPDFQALLASDEWNGNVTGTPNSFGDLAELAKYEARLTAQVTEAKTDMDNFQTEIAGEVTTAKEDLNAIVDNYQVTVNQQLAEKVTWVTPEVFGAVGDGIADDTTALQNAIDYAIENEKKFIATSKYLTSQTILIKSNYKLFGYFDFEKSTVTYSGTGSAFLIQGYNGAIFKFGYIEALNGNCIEFYSELGTEDRTQYCNLSFLRLKANQTTGKCIYIHNALVGWTNQNVVYGGEFTGGYYGIYIEENASSTTYTINGWQFHNMGFEGCEINIYIKANSNAVNGLLFDGVRFEEHKVKLTRIDGNVSNVTINVVSGEIKRSHLSFLNQDLIVNITVNGVVVSEDASQLLGYGFNLAQFNERYLMYYTANTAQIVSALNSEANASVTLTNATGYGNI